MNLFNLAILVLFKYAAIWFALTLVLVIISVVRAKAYKNGPIICDRMLRYSLLIMLGIHGILIGMSFAFFELFYANSMSAIPNVYILTASEAGIGLGIIGILAFFSRFNVVLVSTVGWLFYIFAHNTTKLWLLFDYHALISRDEIPYHGTMIALFFILLFLFIMGYKYHKKNLL